MTKMEQNGLLRFTNSNNVIKNVYYVLVINENGKYSFNNKYYEM